MQIGGHHKTVAMSLIRLCLQQDSLDRGYMCRRRDPDSLPGYPPRFRVQSLGCESTGRGETRCRERPTDQARRGEAKRMVMGMGPARERRRGGSLFRLSMNPADGRLELPGRTSMTMEDLSAWRLWPNDEERLAGVQK